VTTPPRNITRRQSIGLTAGALLGIGLWPGCLRARNHRLDGEFNFLVVNDTHYQTDRCGRFLEGVVAGMKAGPAVDFCIIAGDLADKGAAHEIGSVKEIFTTLGVPLFVVPGNHDYLSQTDRSAYNALFPSANNYYFKHKGWQFVGLDTTEGLRYEKTSIADSTLRWLDDHLRDLSKRRPTVCFTHFPLGNGAPMRPSNADALLERFRDFNLLAVFSGHHHGFTERSHGNIRLVTNRCCAISRGNHDKTKEKGYFLCQVREGVIERTFVEVSTAVS
jgi:Icc-related predicted phosphoesterase